MRSLLARLACWWYGHADAFVMEPARTYLRDGVVIVEPARLFLDCRRCGRQTPGWVLDARRPVPRGRKLLRFKKRLPKVA